MQYDFLARQQYYIDHLAPLWNALQAEERGQFFVRGELAQEYASKKLKNPKICNYIDEGDCGSNIIITASYGDAVRAADHDEGRQVVLLEHGIGLTFGKAAYADGEGQRDKMALIPVQSEYILEKVNPNLRHIPHPVVGIPKLDVWAEEFNKPHLIPKRPTVAVAFHHGDKHSRPAETGSAWEHYVDVLPLLSKHYRLIVHAHPSSAPGITEFYRSWALEYVDDFEEVMRQADLFAGDCGSAAYEFCATGKPVILLNAPWFDKKSSWGIRFWDYANIGIQVDEPHVLEMAIEQTLAAPSQREQQRKRMVHDLMANFGTSTYVALNAIRELKPVAPVHVQTKIATPVPAPAAIKINKPIRTSLDQGILYMCFGAAAQKDLMHSLQSLRNTGSDLPVAVIGDVSGIGFSSIEWKGRSPFDSSKNSHFQFRAGHVKPFFYGYTPFKETMYVDTDTEFLACPDAIFGMLQHWDFLVAQERLMLSELYNRRGAGWEHDISERDVTIREFGGDNGDFPFWNSGMFVWQQNKAVEGLFKLWYEEWMRFQGWDEQKALMRAANRSKARVFVLGEIWNYPHREEIREHVHQAARIILHEYGRGSSRVDITGDEKWYHPKRL